MTYQSCTHRQHKQSDDTVYCLCFGCGCKKTYESTRTFMILDVRDIAFKLWIWFAWLIITWCLTGPLAAPSGAEHHLLMVIDCPVHCCPRCSPMLFLSFQEIHNKPDGNKGYHGVVHNSYFCSRTNLRSADISLHTSSVNLYAKSAVLKPMSHKCLFSCTNRFTYFNYKF